MSKPSRQQLIRGGTNGGFGGIDQRIVYGAECTWWDVIRNAKFRSGGIPICPNCFGPLFEMQNEPMFWAAVAIFEEGGKGFKRPHPGYKVFMEWLRRRCFKNIIVATTMYKASTGLTIDLHPDEFAYPQDEGETKDEL